MSSPNTGVDPALRRARVAVAALFVANGLLLANMVPWYPVIKADLGLSKTTLGLAVAGYPGGALLLGALSGPLIARFGSARTAVWACVATAALLPVMASAPSAWVFGGAMLGMGAGDAIMDAAMNAHGLRVQRRYGRSIINGFHARWSVGAVAGGLAASGAIAIELPRTTHLATVAAVVAIGVVVIRRWLLAGPEHTERQDEAHGTHAPGLVAAMRLAPLVLVGLGVLLMVSAAVEDAAGTWSGVFLQEVVDAPAGLLGFGFVAAQVMMVVGRMSGDRLVDRFGPVRVARTGLLVAALGVLVVATSSQIISVLVGFGLSGLGVATIFPLGLAAAGEIADVRSGDGVTIVSWLARVGFLVVAPTIGAVADILSLPIALGLVVVAAVAGSFLTPLVATATVPATADDPAPDRPETGS